MNINLKRAIVGLALSFSMGMANATTVNITNLGDLTGYGPEGYWDLFYPSTGLFSDTYNFSILSASDVSGAVMKFGTRSVYGINNLTLTLNDRFNSPIDQGALSYERQLAQGDYSFTVAGNAVGSSGGQYFFSAAAAPVPEPSSWALMLGGLGLIGFMSYRRRQYF